MMRGEHDGECGSRRELRLPLSVKEYIRIADVTEDPRTR